MSISGNTLLRIQMALGGAFHFFDKKWNGANRCGRGILAIQSSHIRIITMGADMRREFFIGAFVLLGGFC